jgi:hypothetical protein
MTDNVTAASQQHTARAVYVHIYVRKGCQCAASGRQTDRQWITLRAANAGPHQLRLCAQLAHSKAQNLLLEA